MRKLKMIYILTLLCALVVYIGGYYDGKHAADRWWQAERKTQNIKYNKFTDSIIDQLAACVSTTFPQPVYEHRDIGLVASCPEGWYAENGKGERGVYLLYKDKEVPDAHCNRLR